MESDHNLKASNMNLRTERDLFRSEKSQQLAGRLPRRGVGMPGFDLHPDSRRFAVLMAARAD